MTRIILSLFLMLAMTTRAQNSGTVRQQMDYIHITYGVDFVYDSSLDVNAPYTGKTIKGLRLKDALDAVFSGTGISYAIRGRYVVLRRTIKQPAKGARKPAPARQLTLSGFVRDENGEPLISATVYDTNTGSGTTTNAYGFYSLTLPEGRHSVRVSYVGYDDHTAAVLLNGDRRSDIILHPCANIKEVIITGDMNSRMLTTQTGKRTLSAEDLDKGFSLLSSPDLVKTLQRTSGVSEGIELASGMYVHGGNDDENLFLIDGTPLYQINHCVGLFSAFNTDVIRNVDFYKSGFPARYGGRLSSVTDVRTKDGNMFHTHGSYTLSSMEGRFQIDGPIVKGRTSYNIGIRRTWLDLAMLPLAAAISNSDGDDKISIGYFLHDINGKITHVFSQRSKMFLSLYSGMDRLKTTDKYDQSSDGITNIDNTKCLLTWGNLNAALNWNYVFSPHLFANFSTVFTYNSSIYKYYDDARYGSTEVSTTHIDHFSSSKIYDTVFKADFDCRPNSRNHIRFGADYTWHIFCPQTQTRYDYSGTGSVLPDTIRSRSTNRTVANEVNLYAEDEIHLSPRWNINVGAHATIFSVNKKTYFTLDPRVAIKYQLTPSTSLKAAVTGMTQTVHRLGNTYLSMPTDYWVPTTDRLRPMRSVQFAAGIYSRLSRRWFVSLEGYLKNTSHLLMYTNLNGLTPPAANWDLFVSKGKGRFYGVEADATYKAGRMVLDASYTLSWNKRLFGDLCPSWFHDKFDNRHKLTFSLHCKIGKRSEMYASWTGHTGNRVSMPTQYIPLPNVPWGTTNSNSSFVYVYGSPNNLVLPFYHRLDVGFNTRHITKKGHERIWNISLYNAYCSLNKLYAEIDWTAGGQPKLKAYGVIPIIPSASYTIKF